MIDCQYEIVDIIVNVHVSSEFRKYIKPINRGAITILIDRYVCGCVSVVCEDRHQQVAVG